MDGGTTALQTKTEIRLADYKPPAFFVDNVHLTFDIGQDTVLVTAVGQYRRNKDMEVADLILDGGPYMALKSVALDGHPLPEADYRLTSDSLTVASVPDEFSLIVVTELKPAENTRLEGLYASGGNLCTQCEAEGFRHITYYIDRPDVLAVYDVRIEADKARYPVLLSNGDKVGSGDLEGGRHYAEWGDPFPKPCYLFALVAGDLAVVSDTYVTKSNRKVDLNIYVREPDIDKCDHAMQSLKRSMKWDEDVFGLEYDLSVYNIVAVSDFNMGAMENKGLNIFNTKYVLASPETATDSDFDHVEGVIGHEYFHNWTGNRVTCRDWFQLSLKEGLTVYRDQEFSSDMGSRAVKRIEDVRALRMLQFPEDAGPLAHPVRPESYIEINNFYTTTIYNKGAEVIRMMARILVEQNFRKGVGHYLSTFDGQAATCEDFVVSMEQISGIDLQQFRLWYSQAGTPKLEVKRHYEDGQMTLSVQQSLAPTPGQDEKLPMHIPLVIDWYDKEGEPIEVGGPGEISADGRLLHVTQDKQEFVFTDCPENAIPSLHRGFCSPVILSSDLSNLEKNILFAKDTDPYVRWQAGQELLTEYLLGEVRVESACRERQAEELGNLSAAIGKILKDDTLDPAFAAELVSIPSEVTLGQQQEVLTPEALYETRVNTMGHLAESHWDSLLERICQLAPLSVGVGSEVAANRKLRNTLLGFASYAPKGETTLVPLVTELFASASNMTDQFAALSIMCHRGWKCTEDALEQFYSLWKEDDLVIDKWFAVQAQSPFYDAVDGISKLMEHEAFSLSNPNRLRSVVSMFAMANQLNFHEKSGQGYRLLSDVVSRVDKINPQTAARMVAPLGRWARLDEGRRKQMLAALERLVLADGISDDVRELAEKSLL